MRLVITLLLLAVLATVTTAFGFAVWDGTILHHDQNLRAIHYDTKYDLSSQRRMPAQ